MSTKTYIELDNRMFRIRNRFASGFVKLLNATGSNAKEAMETIGKDEDEPRDIIYNHITDAKESLKDVRISDNDIDYLLERFKSPLSIDSILYSCQRLVLEELPVSDNELIADAKSILKDMNISIGNCVLMDYMHSVVLTDRKEEAIISYLHQDFKWSNDVGNAAWENLMVRKRFKGLMIFSVSDSEDICTIDMMPKSLGPPRFVKYTENNKEKVKKFISLFRESKIKC